MYVELTNSNEHISSACGHAQSSDPRSRACRTSGNKGVLSDVVPELFMLSGLKSVFLKASNPDMHGDRPPATQHILCHRLRPDLAAHVDRA